MVLFAVEWMWAVSLTDASSLLQLVRHERRPSTKLVPPFQGRQVLVRTYEHTYTYYVVGHVRTVKYYLLACVNVVVHSFYMLLKCTR